MSPSISILESTVPGTNIHYLKCSHCSFATVKRSGMDLHQKVNHPAATTTTTTTTTATNKVSKLERDPQAPFPEVQKYYNVKVEGLRTHKFGTRFIELRITFNSLEDQPLPAALQIVFKILQNIYTSLTRDTSSNDLIRFVMTSDQFGYPMDVPFLTKEQSSINCIMDELNRVLQSYKNF